MFQDCVISPVEKESKAFSCVSLPVMRFTGCASSRRDDAVIQEMELTVTVNGLLHHRTTCSPWNVEELVVGGLFLADELDRRDQVRDVRVDLEAGEAAASIAYAVGGARGSGFRRARSSRRLSPLQVNECIALLEDRSLLFRRTGGVHSAVLVDEGGVVAWFEDIGRHSALDKLAGWCFLSEVDMADKTILFSGRVPREIILKVIGMGCPVVISPGAPTNLSVELACRWGITLIGFAKNGAFNVYAHPERIA